MGELHVADIRKVLAPAFEDGGWVMEDLVVGILDMFDLANVLRSLMAISGEAVDFVRSSGHVQSFIELVIV